MNRYVCMIFLLYNYVFRINCIESSLNSWYYDNWCGDGLQFLDDAISAIRSSPVKGRIDVTMVIMIFLTIGIMMRFLKGDV